MSEDQEAKSFIGEIEIQKEFKAVPRVVSAEVHYLESQPEPKFVKVVLDGEPVSLSQVSKSSLLKAYAKHRFKG